jgi:ArsR family transcriptional regulator
VNLVSVLKACADETRIELIRALAAEGELCVSDLVAQIHESQPKVSRHLAYLKREGIVADRKSGLNVYYRLATLPDTECASLVELIAGQPIELPDEQPVYQHDTYDSLDVELL